MNRWMPGPVGTADTGPDPLDAVRRALTRTGTVSSDYGLNPPVSWPAGRVPRAAAVLVPILMEPGGARVILTKRASHLRHHPGQIAFPGGKIDAGDASPTAAALREAHEEIGLPPGRVAVLGTLPAHETVTGYTLVPVIGRVEAPFHPVPEAGEVDEVFSVPLSHLCDPARYRVERRIWQGGWRNYYIVPWGPYYIWGATALILHALARRMTP